MRADYRAAALLALCACGGAFHIVPKAPAAASAAAIWLSTPDRVHLLERQPDAPFGTVDSAGVTRITVDASQRFQSMVGFGAAITDASAELIQQRLTPGPREALLQELFGRRGDGVGFSFVRLTIGSSDFSRTHVTYDDVSAGARDSGLAHFSIASAEANVIPLVRRARAINPDLSIMATPWSAPAWMKSSQSLVTGTLNTEAYPAFAEYLRRSVESLGNRGVPIAWLSVQNEPHFEPKDYPGMRFTPAQRAAFVGQHLGPLFASRNVRTKILDWDHNWDEPQSPLAVLSDSVARRYIAGVAWHCYAGDVAAQSQVHDVHPDTDAFFTECAGGAWAPNFADNLRWNVRTLIIGTTRNWARGVAFWNLALDTRHGPHLGGCNDCRGVITIDSATGAITRNEEYYALAHASRFVRPGAQRIASTTGVDDLDTVAFRNANDGSLVLLVVNSARAPRSIAVTGGDGRTSFRATIPAGAVITCVWSSPTA